MFLDLVRFLLGFLFKFIGFGIKGEGEFEEGESFRKKLNLRIQKEKTDVGLPLFEGTLHDAYKIAEESNGILLLMFLNSNDGDSLQFEKSVLKDEEFATQLRDISFKTPIITLSDLCNHYHFAASRQFGIGHFPAIVIKTKLQDKFQTVLCYEGFIDRPKLLGLIQSVLLACEAEIAQAAEISAMRSLQNEQNAAYTKSLEIDKEKLRKKQQSEDSGKDHVLGESSVQNIQSCSSVDTESELKTRIGKACLDLEDEPESNFEGNFRFQFLFPDGSRKIRSFSSTSTTKSLFDFIFSSGISLKNPKIAIRSIEPPLEFVESNEIIQLKSISGIGKRIKLFIEYI